jgi:prepilin-type N-terminal cleavage/methylation domain-containing protein
MNKGFTLIELLVVISIIGVLASVTLVALNDARISAKYVVAQSNMRQIEKSLAVTDDLRGLIRITGSGCSGCYCRTTYGAPTDLRNIPSSSTCFSRWQTAIDRINDNTTYFSDASGFYRDPWGSPYVLDENENEFPHNLCRRDYLLTVGADGRLSTADDFIIRLEFRTGQCR